MSAPTSVRARLRRALSVLVSTLMVAGGLSILAPTAASAAVPTLPANSSQVVVKTGGERNAATGVVAPLAGVALELHAASGNALITTCVSDAGGDCVFTVPNTTLATTNDFVVVQAASFQAGSAAADDYFRNASLVTSTDGTNFAATDYRLPVNDVLANTTRTVGAGGSGVSMTSGVWPNSYDNPAAKAQCGLNIALVSDLSYSVAISNSLDDLKTAASGFVSALAGTPSTISLYTFGTTAPAPGTSTVSNKSTLNTADVTELLDTIDDYEISNQSYTNWDAALRQLYGAGFDQVVVITDGNPTRSGIPATGSSSNTRFVELENAIFSANTLKAAGTRIVTVGVGGSSNFAAGQNLRAISGPTVGSDYFISGWSDLAATLDDLARDNCEGSVTVVKQVVPWNAAGITGATPTGGWGFTAPAVTTGTVTPSTAQTTKANPGQGDNGTVNYKLDGIPAGSTFTLSEVQQPGYSLIEQGAGNLNAVCVKNGGTSVPVTDVGTLGFSIPVGEADIVTCTVYNRAPQPTATITVHKQWVVNGTPGTLDQFPAGYAATVSIAGAAGTWGTSAQVNAGTVVIDESAVTVPSPYCTLTGQHVTSFNGAAPTGQTDLAGATSYTTPALAQGSANSVTVTNTVTCAGQLTLLKNVVNGTTGGTAAPGAWTLTATPTTGTAISGATGVTGSATLGATYTLTESGGPAGYQLSAIVCATSATGPWTGPSVTSVTVGAQEHVYCRFTNTAIAPRLQLNKVVTGGVSDADNWTLTATSGGSNVSGDGLAPYAAVVAGQSYALAEAPVAGFDGSEFDASAWTCTVTAGPGTGTTVGTGSAVTPALGQDIECVVTNTARAVVPAFDKAAGTATANAATGTWDVTYTLTATNPSSVLPLVYDLVDTPKLPAGVQPVAARVTTGATTVLNVAAWTGTALAIADDAQIVAGGAPVVYTVTLTVAIPSTTAAAMLVCGTAGHGLDNSATLTPKIGAPITDTACVTVVPPTVTPTKKVVSVTQDPATGEWVVVYDVKVTAAGTGVARYDLTDAFAFGTGISVVSSSVTAAAGTPSPVAGWTGVAPHAALVQNGAIAGGTSQTYTVTVRASVAKDVTGTPAADCTVVAPESGTGFLNRAALTAAGSTTVVSDCATPAVPTLDKSFVSATQNPDASWAVTFSVSVTNPDAKAALAYSLSDVPGFPAGVTITNRVVTLDGAPLAWDGTSPLVANRVLPAGENDLFVVVFTVTVDPGMSSALRACDVAGPGHGFFNSATLTSGTDIRTDADCGPVAQSVLPLVAKVVDGGYPRQLADGDWEIRYSVTVSTPPGTTLSTRYDLDDTLAFGAGMTIVSASATGPAGAVAAWTGVTPAVGLADDVLLPAGASHVYTVLVRTELAAGVAASAAADCVRTGAETGTGFLNTVALRSGTATRAAEACASPVLPTLAKTLAAAPVKNADGTVDITYTVTVGNATDTALVYDLDDKLGFATGVAVLGATVTGPAGVTVDTTWTGRGATTRVVTAQALPAKSSHVYTVVVHARPTLFVADDDLACRAHDTGHGYFNGAVLTSGADVLTADACAPIPTTDLPTLALTGTSIGGGMLAALGLLLAGLVLLVVRRGRRAAPRH